ncbi:MAG: sulfite reductase [Rhodobacteraceae bacterium]|nr:sulfite reductase [Paracoccaceae bacterium]
MKALTANRLIDGEVVWLGRSGQWVEMLQSAWGLETPEAEAEALAIGAKAVADRLLVDPYLIDLRRTEDGIEAVRFRERIRAKGPTTRPDLGKQARRETSAA